MALLTNIEALLKKERVESNRIEFKASWNQMTVPSIYRSICAFANDFDNIGGGYIVVGAEECDGVCVRPVKGIDESQLDEIQKHLLAHCKYMDPEYSPVISIEEADERKVLVIWVPSGESRPYKIPENVNSCKGVDKKFYIRFGSVTKEAKGNELNELLALKDRQPFDERGNSRIRLEDISAILVRDYLVKVKSKLLEQLNRQSLDFIMESMGLYTGPQENRVLKNVAAMMFCPNPEKFFPYTQAEIVIYPNGREKDPENMIEVPVIRGSIPEIISNVLVYMRTNVIRETVCKQRDDEHSIKHFNYPYQAIEEAVVNAFYHRDYQEHEPVEISIEPHRISILSYSGPERSISDEDLREAKVLRSRRYRNRRLGEFLKELNLAEGRATGVPTIQRELENNGSSCAIIKTDEHRSFFLIDIPCHSVKSENLKQNKESVQTLLAKMDKKGFFRQVSQLILDISLQTEEVEKINFPNVEMLNRMLVIMLTLREQLSLQQLAERTKESHSLVRRAVRWLLDVKLVDMSSPDNPNSNKQKYMLSSLGSDILENHYHV